MSDRKIDLSSEQEAVRDASEPRFVVTAAAGSGKTAVLVERYLKHVREDGIAPDQILTITFTRKAAAQMKRRIVDALREAGRREDAQIAETGPIQTIHGFCERLLRENALEAGLDPEYEVSSESQTTRLMSRCVRETLAEPMDDLPHSEALLRELAGKGSPGGTTSPHALLEDAVQRTVRALRGSGHSLLAVAEAHEDPRVLMGRFQTSILAATPPELRFAMQGVGLDEFHDRLRLAYKEARIRAPEWLTPKANFLIDLATAGQACGLVALGCEAWRRLERQMWLEQRLDFAALEAGAVRLLSGSEATRERLCQTYRVVMVDEAQDVNPIQHKLISLIGVGCEMLVGDAQQSIYGFRQADVELFKQKAIDTPVKSLSKNYRSGEGILKFIDTLFGRLWGEGYRPMAAPASPMDLEQDAVPNFAGVEFWIQKERDTTEVALWIKALIEEERQKPEGLQAKDIAVLVRGARYGLDLLAALDRAKIPAKIAGGSERFYARLEVRDLANALRALADPYDDFSLLATLRSPFAGLSLDSIGLLALAKPVVDSLGAFEPPVEGDREKLDRFLVWYLSMKEYADRLPAWEVISELFAVSGYLEALATKRNAHQLLANVRKLLTLAAEEPELGPLEYAERIREIQDLRHKEGDAPAVEEDADLVTVVTIHKAKGLEFRAVIVPETDRPLGSRPNMVEVEPRIGLVATKFEKDSSLYHRWLAWQRRQRELQEEERILYVALTRAMERLCICVHPNGRERSIARLIPATVGFDHKAPPGASFRWTAEDMEDQE